MAPRERRPNMGAKPAAVALLQKMSVVDAYRAPRYLTAKRD